MLEQRGRIWRNSQHRCTTITSTVHSAQPSLAQWTLYSCTTKTSTLHSAPCIEYSAQLLQKQSAMCIHQRKLQRAAHYDILGSNAMSSILQTGRGAMVVSWQKTAEMPEANSDAREGGRGIENHPPHTCTLPLCPGGLLVTPPATGELQCRRRRSQ